MKSTFSISIKLIRRICSHRFHFSPFIIAHSTRKLNSILVDEQGGLNDLRKDVDKSEVT